MWYFYISTQYEREDKEKKKTTIESKTWHRRRTSCVPIISYYKIYIIIVLHCQPFNDLFCFVLYSFSTTAVLNLEKWSAAAKQNENESNIKDDDDDDNNEIDNDIVQ